jgi:hypothetical protein
MTEQVKTRQDELDRLVTAMVAQAPTDCLLVDIMLEVLDLKVPIRPCPMASASSNQTSRLHGTRFYPPIYRRGPVNDQDRPFAEYGHTSAFVFVDDQPIRATMIGLRRFGTTVQNV